MIYRFEIAERAYRCFGGDSRVSALFARVPPKCHEGYTDLGRSNRTSDSLTIRSYRPRKIDRPRGLELIIHVPVLYLFIFYFLSIISCKHLYTYIWYRYRRFHFYCDSEYLILLRSNVFIVFRVGVVRKRKKDRNENNKQNVPASVQNPRAPCV